MNGKLGGNRLKDVVAWIEERLSSKEKRERENFRKVLLQSLLEVSPVETVLNADRTFSESEILKIHFALKKIEAGEPLQYAVNQGFFRGQMYVLNGDVLIPRPETEELVEAVLPHIQPADKVWDIGTGSGCIAISIALETGVKVEAWDISEKALLVAKSNAQRLKALIDFVQADILITDEVHNLATVWISNPPYVLESEKADMQPEVVGHEPHVALFVPNESPLLFYRKIAELAQMQKSTCRILAFETHENFAHEVAELFDTSNWEVRIITDLQEKNRIVFAEKK
jgi:release factor glutamine methyltransferase